MLIKGAEYRLFNIDEGVVSRLWMPTKHGLDKPNRTYIQRMQSLRRHGLYTLEPGQMAGASGISGTGGGGSGASSFFILLSSEHGGNGTLVKLNPTANTIYYLGLGAIGDSLNYAEQSLSSVVPVVSTLKAAYWHTHIAGTLASAGNVVHAVRKNETTDTAGANIAWTSTTNTGSEPGLSVSYSAGDRLTGKLTTPAWGTTPTNGVIHAGLSFTAP